MPLQVTVDELHKIISPVSRVKASSPRPPGSKPTVFLSTSFKRTPQVAAQENLIREVFSSKFAVKGGWEISGGGQLAKILRGIKASDVMVTEATYLVPNVMLEMGMAYALAHKAHTRVFLLFNLEAPNRSIADLPGYVRTLDIISYTFDAARLREARDKIYETLQVEPEPEELMSINLRGRTLRPHPDKSGLFLYYSPKRDVWKSILDDIRHQVEAAGQTLYTRVAASSGSTQLEEVIYGVCRSSSRFPVSCFVDTTGDPLVGAFALGAAVALGRGAERLQEATDPTALGTQSIDISLWAEPIFVWQGMKDLAEHMIDASQRGKRKQGRRRP
jgi:hypothetical protein